MLANGKPELLVPASSLDVLKVAVMYGADAVYIGGEMYGLRAKAKNFSNEDIKAGIEFAHKYGKRVFITANITAHNKDLEGVRKYFEELKEIKPDALIISDPGVFTIAKEVCPEIEIHISTQANNVNYADYLFFDREILTRSALLNNMIFPSARVCAGSEICIPARKIIAQKTSSRI